MPLVSLLDMLYLHWLNLLYLYNFNIFIVTTFFESLLMKELIYKFEEVKNQFESIFFQTTLTSIGYKCVAITTLSVLYNLASHHAGNTGKADTLNTQFTCVGRWRRQGKCNMCIPFNYMFLNQHNIQKIPLRTQAIYLVREIHFFT